jgi:hypothetical protein
MQLLLVEEKQIKFICIIWLNIKVLTDGIHVVNRIHFFPSLKTENAQYECTSCVPYFTLGLTTVFTELIF